MPSSVDDAVAEGEVDGLPAEVLERILALPSVRQDRLSSAMLAVAEGRVPDAGTLADKMVGRLVCDRLR